MATYTKEVLSASTDGRQIKVAATTVGAATTIHTGPTDPLEQDEVWLWASNTSTSPVQISIAWGGVSDPDDLVEFTIQPETGPVLMTPGWIIKGNATPLIVKAFAGSANVVNIGGFVNAIV